MRALTVIFTLLALVMISVTPGMAQYASEHPIIAPENVRDVVEIATLGRGAVNQIAWTPDGRAIALASSTGVWFYDPSHPNDAPHLFNSEGNEVLRMAFSPDGELLATQEYEYQVSPQGGYTLVSVVRVWQVKTQNQIQVWSQDDHFLPTDPFPAMAFNANGTLLALITNSGAGPSTVHLKRIGSDDDVQMLESSTHHFRTLIFRSENSVLVFGSSLKNHRVWEVHSDKAPEIRWQYDATDTPLFPTFNLTGEIFAVGHWNGGETELILYAATTGDELENFVLPNFVFSNVMYRADHQLYSVNFLNELNLVSVRNMQSGTVRYLKDRTDVRGQNSIFDARFSPDEAKLVTVDRNHVVLWDLETGSQVAELSEIESGVTELGFSPDSRWIAVGRENGSVEIWRADTLEKWSVLWTGRRYAGETRFAFAPKGDVLVTLGELQIQFWDVATGTELRAWRDLPKPSTAIAYSTNGKWLAVASDDFTIHVWDVEKQIEVVALDGHSYWVEALAFSPDGTRMISGSTDASIKLWDVATWSEIDSFDTEISVTAARYSSDGTLLVANTQIFAGGGNFSPIKLWSMETATPLPILGDQQAIESGFSHDGTLLISLSLWPELIEFGEIETGRVLRYLPASPWGKRLAVSPDGSMVLTGDRTGLLHVWALP